MQVSVVAAHIMDVLREGVLEDPPVDTMSEIRVKGALAWRSRMRVRGLRSPVPLMRPPRGPMIRVALENMASDGAVEPTVGGWRLTRAALLAGWRDDVLRGGCE